MIRNYGVPASILDAAVKDFRLLSKATLDVKLPWNKRKKRVHLARAGAGPRASSRQSVDACLGACIHRAALIFATKHGTYERCSHNDHD